MLRKFSPLGYFLGLVFKGAQEAIEEQSAKRDLEQKLGRKISNEELYSLGAHIDAAGEINTAQPLVLTPRESEIPFAGAKPPMSLTTKLLIVVPLFLLFVFGAASILKSMPEQSLYGLNPFSPNPPEDVFFQNIGDFALTKRPDYHSPNSSNPVPRFEGEYKNGTQIVHYIVSVFDDEAEAAAAFNKLRETVHGGQNRKVFEKSDSRIFVGAMAGWDSDIYFTDGRFLKKINSFNQKSALDFEGILKNAPPLPIGTFSADELKSDAPAVESTTGVTELLNYFSKKSPGDNGIYKDKIIKFKGTIESSGRSKKGDWILGFMRPGSTSPTAGMVVASFEKSKEYDVAQAQKGDEVILQCKVSMKVHTSVILENCSKLRK